MKIQEVKQQLNASTSEELFGIPPLPEQINPNVEAGIRIWNNAQKDILDQCKALKKIDTVEEAEAIANYIIWAIGNLNVSSEYREMQAHCDATRNWGQGWKDTAKQAIDEADNAEIILKILS